MTTPRPPVATQQFHDQILASLRDSDRLLSTPEIAAKHLAPHPVTWTLRASLNLRTGDTIRGHRVIRAQGIDDYGNIIYLVAKPAPSREIYRHLRKLEQAGDILRVPCPDPAHRRNCIHWAYLGQSGVDAEREIAELNALFNLSTADPRPQQHDHRPPETK
ncbi:hypothetical protein [Mycolicibacterium sp.]|uniref:hypothetical protein n=1 Tax=Mycolicibacterium sp. TaxID=2320850 RepID=UPI0037CB362E